MVARAVAGSMVLLLFCTGLNLALGATVTEGPRAALPYPLLPPDFAPPEPPPCAQTGPSVLFPAPAPAPGCDAYDWASYLHLGGDPDEGYGRYPADFAGCTAWKHASCRTGNPALDMDSAELYGVSGMGVDQAWRLSTGRPDVVLAVIDSGINWDARDLIEKAYLNLGELPPPGVAIADWRQGSYTYRDYDTNGDGVVSVADWANDLRVSTSAGPSPQGQSLLDPQDLIWTFSDGIDDDENGYVDDISGWNVLDDDNDPWDELRYGHGTGEGEDAAGQAGNGVAGTGSCPNCRVLQVRQGQSFIAHVENYAQGVLFAVDSGASVIQSALGSIDANRFALASHEYAWNRGVPIVASAADEAAGHHNMPTNLLHAMNFNSIRPLDASPGQASGWLYLNGCTNYMATLTASVSSTSCSSEAVAQAAGITGLLLSHARDLRDRGHLAPHPASGANVLSPNEVEQVLMTTADDIDFSRRSPVALQPVPTTRYPTGPGYDPYTGAGRLNAASALWSLDAGRIPPEAELQEPRWWQQFDPAVEATVQIGGLVGALRGPAQAFEWNLDYACGINPAPGQFIPIATGSSSGRFQGPLATWNLAETGADSCQQLPAGRVEDAYAVTLRLRVTDADGLVGADRIPLSIRHDPDRHLLTRHLGASGESSTAMVDMDGDNQVDLLVPTSDGVILGLRGDGTPLPGFPLKTDPLDVHLASPAFARGAIARPLESIGPGGIAVGDLDRDGRPEVVAASLVGKVYAWHHDGSRVAGFPVAADTVHAQRLLRDPYNPVMTGFVSQPVLGDLDGDGDLEILQSGLDRHLYAWHHDGSQMAGFPHHVLDRATVNTATVNGMELVTGPADGHTEIYRGGKIVATPTLAELDGDPLPEIVLGTNDHYREIPNWAADEPVLWPFGQINYRADVISSGNGRLFALDWNPDTQTVGSLPGWPVSIGVFVAELLPYVGEGIPTSAAAADIDRDGVQEIAIFSTAGPAYVLRSDGSSLYGHDLDGRPRVLPGTTRGPASNVADAPVIPALGLPSIGDLDGDGSLDLVVPAVGLGRALDIVLAGEQLVSDDAVQAWDLATGTVKPAFPQRVEDLQFITNPTLVDIDGDGQLEVLSGNGMGVLHAFGSLGNEPAGWPKHTGQWIIDAPSTGDLDGDGRLEVAITTREGDLWVWSTQAPAEARRDWWSQHRDEWNTGNHDLDATPPAAPAFTRGPEGWSWMVPGDDGWRGQAAAIQVLDANHRVIATLGPPATGGQVTDWLPCGGAWLRALDDSGNVGWPTQVPHTCP